MIKLFCHTLEIPITTWKFPGGEVGVKIPEELKKLRYKVVMNFEGSDDIMMFLNVCDALKHKGIDIKDISGIIKYLPYARQDRVCSEGESHALDVFLKVLKTAHCGEFVFHDMHSNVSTDLLDQYGFHYYHVEQHYCGDGLPLFDTLIAPDKGALDKIYKHRQVDVCGTHVVCLSKSRVGSIIIYDDYPFDTISGNVCVVDDLCDGGGTFISLGKMLKLTQPDITSLNLYVTHGLFSKGTEELSKLYDKIYTNNLMNDSVVDQVTITH
jgi:ribose-phosphate pyrophosphokinase